MALAAAIADRKEIEWEREAAGARDEKERALVEAMRLLDRVASARARGRRG